VAGYTVERTLSVPVQHAFDVIVAEDVLRHVLHRYGPVPAVVGTRELTGPWDTPGSQRTVVLEGGDTVRETVLSWERPARFAYRVDSFEGLIGRLVDHAVGEWWFSPQGSGSAFRWTYTFEARRLRWVVLVFARTAWAGYMRQCADRCVARAEAS
jgi:hypothetical protein